ncbi:MAG: hypothetical protein QOH57_1211 [Mycobacterium sp.]|jgi:hypothetical protein|nr:hypothetical protein [Mycobacterium sp.]
MTVQLAEIEQVLGSVEHSESVVLDPGPQMPERWRPIADSDDPQARRQAALSLWNADFLALVPDFAAALESELADVHVGHLGDDAVLVYAFEHYDAGGPDRYVVCWIGWDPALFTDSETPLFSSIPQPVQAFYRDVHAGFLGPDWLSYGLIQPRHLQSYAEFVGLPEGVPDWPEEDPDSTRLLVLASTGGNVHLCVSPDLDDGQALTIYDGVADPPEDFDALLDHTMTEYFVDPVF